MHETKRPRLDSNSEEAFSFIEVAWHAAHGQQAHSIRSSKGRYVSVSDRSLVEGGDVMIL